MKQPNISMEMPVPSQGHCAFPVVDWSCLFVYLYQFCLSLWKIPRSAVILLLPIFGIVPQLWPIFVFRFISYCFIDSVDRYTSFFSPFVTGCKIYYGFLLSCPKCMMFFRFLRQNQYRTLLFDYLLVNYSIWSKAIMLYA